MLSGHVATVNVECNAQVVLMNQVTTRVTGDNQAKLVPALGRHPGC